MLNFQDLVQSLLNFWGQKGCVLQQPYDVEVGAGTMHPETFLRVLGPEPYSTAYVEPSRRPADGRYGENPNRLEKHHQMQVILKPPPADIQNIYLESLTAMGINLKEHDIKFEEDNWEAPTLGAWGVGWQVMLDGQEITQFTYFQQAGGLDLFPITGEITYGLERICMFLNDVDNVYDLPWNDKVTYREVRHRDEYEFSKYYFESADTAMYFRMFNDWERESQRLLKEGLVLAAYECCLKCSHTFNILDARGAISVTERAQIIGRVRSLAVAVAKAYVEIRKQQGYPLLRLKSDFTEDHTQFLDEFFDTIERENRRSAGTSEFYMEIGCEEIPARTMARSLNDLRDRVEKLLQEEKLTYDRVEAIGSARRFVVRVPALAERQESRNERIMGPPASIAFKDGQPAPPLVGFAKKNNVAIEALQKFATDKGEYYGIESTIEGGSATDILAKGLPAIVRAMTFPKMMIWMDPSQRFSRPLRWIISRFGEQRIPMELFGVQSAGYSEGHRILGSGRVEVGSYNDFVEKLEKNFVIVSQEERKKKIERELNEEAGRFNGRTIGDEKLLEEVVYINEYPTIVRGRFEERFLELPREILITVMKEHQKYFAVEDEHGKLLPYFLAVMNTASDSKGLIRKGHERVLRARLTDALFFWEVDRKQTLEDRRPRLKSIVFQEKLGTYADKVKRVARLSKKINTLTKAKVDKAALDKAVQWSKSDLTADMVREFTDLQGIVGGLYAKHDGAPEDVWKAIYDQYRPQSMDDRSPETKSGAVLSISDKLDTVLGCFSVGLIPTGSEDPLGLRRAMQGVIKVLLDHKLPFSMAKAAGDGFTPQLKQFYEDRLRFILGQRGFAYDEINAVTGIGCDDPSETLDRAAAIQKIRSSADFEAVSMAFKRIKNILKQAEQAGQVAGEMSAEGMEPAEAELASFLEVARIKIEKLERRRKYFKILETMAGGRPVIDQFFEKIMVMHQDLSVRKRRLLLLGSLFATFSRVADISEIVVNKS